VLEARRRRDHLRRSAPEELVQPSWPSPRPRHDRRGRVRGPARGRAVHAPQEDPAGHGGAEAPA
jgi:hypothetical protein